MKVALVSEDASPLAVLGEAEASGRHTYIAGLAKALARRGHAVVVYTRRDAWQLPAQCDLSPGVQVKHVTAGPARPATEDERSRYVPAFGRRLIRDWTSGGRPDVVHAHTWRSGAAAVIASRVTGVPVVQTFHEISDTSRGNHPAEQAPTEADLIAAVDHIVATRSSERVELVRRGARPDRVTTATGGVDTDLFSPHGSRWKLNGHRRLVCLGELVERESVDTLLAAITRLSDTEVFVAGGPPSSGIRLSDEAQRLTGMADELGLGARFRLTGTLKHDAVPALLRSADVVVSTPRRARFGLAPLEAMSCGRPVVCTAVDGLADLVDDGATGVLVDPGDADGLAAAIRKLLDDDSLSGRLGEQGRRRAVARYDWKQVAERVEDAYSSLVDAHAPAAAAG